MNVGEDLGEMGESLLRHWCAEIGITANRAERDRTGWDYLLEFPSLPSKEASRALDKSPGPLQCLVQVKTTKLTNNSLSVKLSNWVRLINTPLPSFFLVLRYTKKRNCSNAYLIHVDQAQLARVLKKLRQLSRDPTVGTKMHKRSLALRWTEATQLASAAADAFSQRILEAVGPNPAAYTAAKQIMLRDTGYEDVRTEMDIRVTVPQPYQGERLKELLVDFSIGALATLDVSKADIWDVRFGIRAPSATHHFGSGGKLEVHTKPAKEGLLLLRSPENSREVRVHAQGFGPAGLGALVNEDNFKVRLVLPNSSLVIHPKSGHSQFNIRVPDPMQSRASEELQSTAKLLLFVTDASELSWAPVEMQFCGQALGRLAISGMVAPQQIKDWAHLVIKTHDVLSALDLPGDTAVTPADLFEQGLQIDLLHLLLTRRAERARVEFSLGEPRDLNGKECCMPQLVHAFVGDYRIFVVAAHVGRAASKSEGDQINYVMDVERSPVTRRHALHADEPFPQAVEEMLKAAAKTQEGAYLIEWWRQG